jgi:hypothetical protein
VTQKPSLSQHAHRQNVSNRVYKHVQTLKTSIFPKGRQEIQIRVNNLEDRFDNGTNNTYIFDVSDFAKEYFMEANQHLLNTLSPEQIAQKMSSV